MWKSWVTVLLLALQLLSVGGVSSPVFGVLTQPIRGSNDTMIAASYIKWLEAGGARSIPIPYDASNETVDEIFTQIDGVLFPGGESDLPPSAVRIWELLQSAYQGGDAIPLWATCLGYEFVLQMASQNNSILGDGYNAENISLSLEEVIPDGLYRPTRMLKTVTQRNVTMNNHHMGIAPATITGNPLLNGIWKVTSINHDRDGRPFVSTIEPRDPDTFPVYGVQFHPEKNAFEYSTYPHTDIPYEAINHSPEAISMSLYMTRFLVNLARENPLYRKFHHYSEPDRFPLVISYPVYTGMAFEESYRIPPSEAMQMTMEMIEQVS